MKRLFVLLIFLGTIAGLVYWQKEKIGEFLRPEKVVPPVFQQPVVYDLTALLEKNGLTTSSSPIFVNGTIQASISGVTVIFSPDKDLFSQVRSLQLVLGKLKMEARPISEIDLRFNKVVVR